MWPHWEDEQIRGACGPRRQSKEQILHLCHTLTAVPSTAPDTSLDVSMFK